MKNTYVAKFSSIFLKPLLQAMKKKIRSIKIHHKSLEQIHEYWKAPFDGDNLLSVDYLGKKQNKKQEADF